jgi:hypothetical protein
MKRVGDVMRADPGAVVQRPRNLRPGSAEIIDVNEGGAVPMFLTREEIGRIGYKQVTNWAGRRIWISPLVTRDLPDGTREFEYAPLHEHPDDDPTGGRHRERQMAMSAEATRRLRDKAPRRSTGSERYERG